jgi:hypothetical protein
MSSSIPPTSPPTGAAAAISGGASSSSGPHTFGISEATYVTEVAELILKSRDAKFQKTQFEKIEPHIYEILNPPIESSKDKVLELFCKIIRKNPSLITEERALALTLEIAKNASTRTNLNKLTKTLFGIYDSFYPNKSGKFNDALSRAIETAAFEIAKVNTSGTKLPNLQKLQTVNLQIMSERLIKAGALTREDISNFTRELVNLTSGRTKLPRPVAISIAAIIEYLNVKEPQLKDVATKIKRVAQLEVSTEIGKYKATPPSPPPLSSSPSSPLPTPTTTPAPAAASVSALSAAPASPPLPPSPPETEAIRTEVASRQTIIKELIEQKNQLLAMGEPTREIEARIAGIQTDVVRLITTLGKKKFATDSQYTQYVASFVNSSESGQYACHNCAFNSVINLKKYLGGQTDIDLDDSLTKGDELAKANIRDCPSAYPDTVALTSATDDDDELKKLEGDSLGVFLDNGGNPTQLTEGEELEFYKNFLIEAQDEAGKYGQVGVIICHKQEFYVLHIKKTGDGTLTYTFNDTHGLVKKRGGLDQHKVIPGASAEFGNAYEIKFDNMEDAATFLSVKSPYSKPRDGGDTCNSVEFNYFIHKDARPE